MISIIVAIGNNRAIGFKNSLPWRLPADLEYFKKNTLGKTIVMGQRTFDSIGGRLLPGRKTIVLNNDPNCKSSGEYIIARSIEDILVLAKGEEEIMICGGASIYKQFLPLADRLYLTFIHHDFEADTYFPEIDFSEWQEIKRIDNKPDDKNPYSYSFVIFDKKHD